MATIAIQDLQAGYSLFDDNESYLTDLTSDDALYISGGKISSGLGFTLGVSVGVALVTVVVTIALALK